VISHNGLKKINLRELFKANLYPLNDWQQQAFDTEIEIIKIRHYLTKKFPKTHWNTFRTEILTQFENLLDIPLRPLLIRSWSRDQYLQKISLLNSQAKLEAKTCILPLAIHHLHSEHQPKLVMQLSETETLSLALKVSLELNLSHVVLRLKQGQVDRVMSGTCQGFVSIQYGDTQLANREITKFRLRESFPNAK
jgi:hypothetical protein